MWEDEILSQDCGKAGMTVALARQQSEMKDNQSDRMIRRPGHPSPLWGEAPAQMAVSADGCLSRGPVREECMEFGNQLTPLHCLHLLRPEAIVSLL